MFTGSSCRLIYARRQLCVFALTVNTIGTPRSSRIIPPFSVSLPPLLYFAAASPTPVRTPGVSSGITFFPFHACVKLTADQRP